MSERFVVDFRVAAAERESLYTPDWRWPVPQSLYDDPLREYVDWAYALPATLNHNERLRTAFELVESDLLKDIAAIVGAWFDVSTAKQQSLKLVYGDDQHLYRMLESDSLTSYSMIAQVRSGAESAVRSRPRRIARVVRKWAHGLQSTLKGRPDVHTIGANPLSNELTGDQVNLIRLSFADLEKQRARQHDQPGDLLELSDTVRSKIIEIVTNADHTPTARFSASMGELISSYMAAGYRDLEFTPGFKPNSSMTLFTGTGGSYLSRVVGQAFRRNDASVIRTTHGGESLLFDEPMWPSIELPLTDVYVTYGTKAAETARSLTARHSSVRGGSDQISVMAGGSKYHQQILQRPMSPSTQIQIVHVMSASFSGITRALPNIRVHDVVYYDWHRRLLGFVRSAGFTAVSKRHPKGNGNDLPVYGDVASDELLLARMSDTLDLADAYVVDIAGSALMEAICTLKPVVFVDIPNRRLTDEGRTLLGESVQIVRTEFDENNRVTVDSDQIIEGLRKPVDIDARRRFIHDYLTTPGEGIRDLVTRAFS